MLHPVSSGNLSCEAQIVVIPRNDHEMALIQPIYEQPVIHQRCDFERRHFQPLAFLYLWGICNLPKRGRMLKMASLCISQIDLPEPNGIKLSTTTPPKQKDKPHINNQLIVAKAVIFYN